MKIGLVAWFVCYTSFNTFLYTLHYLLSSKMMGCCHTCVKYDILKEYTLGCTWSPSYGWMCLAMAYKRKPVEI